MKTIINELTGKKEYIHKVPKVDYIAICEEDTIKNVLTYMLNNQNHLIQLIKHHNKRSEAFNKTFILDTFDFSTLWKYAAYEVNREKYLKEFRDREMEKEIYDGIVDDFITYYDEELSELSHFGVCNPQLQKMYERMEKKEYNKKRKEI